MTDGRKFERTRQFVIIQQYTVYDQFSYVTSSTKRVSKYLSRFVKVFNSGSDKYSLSFVAREPHMGAVNMRAAVGVVFAEVSLIR